MNTFEICDCLDAHSGLGLYGARREGFVMQATFEFDPNGEFNAALNLCDLELAYHTPPACRRHTPHFCADDWNTALSHTTTDAICSVRVLPRPRTT